MMQNETQLVLVNFKNLQGLLNPVLNKLEKIESKLSERRQAPKGFYRNKDLKSKFGLSSNTIIKYRESGIIPSTLIGDVHLYPIAKIDELLTKNANY